MSPLLIVLFVILGILFLISIYGSFIRWNASRVTIWFSIKKLDIDRPMEDYAKLLLDENGLVDVEVKKCGFFASLFVGNTYSVSKKLIRISWGTARRSTATNLAAVCRLVGLAKLHADGVKGIRLVEFNRWFGWLPMLLLPLIIIGLILDLVLAESIGTWTIALTGVGLAIALVCFIISAIAAKIYIKSCNIGQTLILDMGILQENEEKRIKKLYSAWKKLIVLQVIINAFEAIYFLLKLIFSSFKLIRR